METAEGDGVVTERVAVRFFAALRVDLATAPTVEEAGVDSLVPPIRSPVLSVSGDAGRSPVLATSDGTFLNRKRRTRI